jgi:hypothetical protein
MGLKKLGFKVQKTVAYFYPDHKFGIERIKVKVVSRECELFIEVWIPWGRFQAKALSMSHDVTFDEFMKRFVSSNTNGQVGDEGRLHRLFKKFIREMDWKVTNCLENSDA